MSAFVMEAHHLPYFGVCTFLLVQGTGAAAWLATRSTIVRDRLLTDPNYLFKCLVEVIIDSGASGCCFNMDLPASCLFIYCH